MWAMSFTREFIFTCGVWGGVMWFKVGAWGILLRGPSSRLIQEVQKVWNNSSSVVIAMKVCAKQLDAVSVALACCATRHHLRTSSHSAGYRLSSWMSCSMALCRATGVHDPPRFSTSRITCGGTMSVFRTFSPPMWSLVVV